MIDLPGVLSRSWAVGDNLYIAIECADPRSLDAKRFVDSLLENCRIVSVTDQRFKSLLATHGWELSYEKDDFEGETLEVWSHKKRIDIWETL